MRETSPSPTGAAALEPERLGTAAMEYIAVIHIYNTHSWLILLSLDINYGFYHLNTSNQRCAKWDILAVEYSVFSHEILHLFPRVCQHGHF